MFGVTTIENSSTDQYCIDLHPNVKDHLQWLFVTNLRISSKLGIQSLFRKYLGQSCAWNKSRRGVAHYVRQIYPQPMSETLMLVSLSQIPRIIGEHIVIWGFFRPIHGTCWYILNISLTCAVLRRSWKKPKTIEEMQRVSSWLVRPRRFELWGSVGSVLESSRAHDYDMRTPACQHNWLVVTGT